MCFCVETVNYPIVLVDSLDDVTLLKVVLQVSQTVRTFYILILTVSLVVRKELRLVTSEEPQYSPRGIITPLYDDPLTPMKLF